MKNKGNGMLLCLLALIGGLLILLPVLILPTVASDTAVTYADSSFDSLTVGSGISNDSVNFFNTTPSLARVVEYKSGRKGIRVPLAPAATGADAIASEIKGGGGNIDKNIQVKNSEMSYANADKVYLSVDYFIASGSKGRVQSQFRYYKSNGASGTWLSLYYIDTATGDFRTCDGAWHAGVLTLGAWNTVTLVVDLDTAQMDFYINGLYLSTETNSTKGNLVLDANTWIIAKINKNSSGLASDYAGYFIVDNARAATFDDSYVRAPEKWDADGNPMSGLVYTGADGASRDISFTGQELEIFSVGGATAKYYDLSAYKDVIAPVKGASMRLRYATGLRFATQLDTDLLETLLEQKESGELRGVEIGTLITPRNFADAAQSLTFEGLDAALNVSTKYLNVKATVGEYYGVPDGVTLDEGYDTCFVGSVVNIKLGNRTRQFAFSGYVKIVTRCGVEGYIYAYDYDADTVADYSRSIVGVAQSALADTTVDWSARELEVMNGIVAGISAVELDSSSIINSVQKTATEVYFRNAEGLCCRLSYGGFRGWRLQVNSRSYDGFNDVGAAQALSLYLGEAQQDTLETLTVTKENGALKICAAGESSYVTVDYTNAFNIEFHSENGALKSNVKSIVYHEPTDADASDEKIEIKGDLINGEAIYGGGERFDVVNKRGTRFALYTSDGWNRTDTTYVAVPLFVTTRGAGIFMNRYERIVADFGKSDTDEWRLELDNDLLDCYFYATGAMTDALLGYTELSGHAGLPDEWAQGEMICRRSPDFSSFDDRADYRTNYATYKDIPNYTSYYVQGTNGSSKIRSRIGSEVSGYTYDYSLLYTSSSTSSTTVAYYQNEKGTYDKIASKYGNPGGDGVKTIVTKLMDAGMKPHSIVMEPWSWSDVGVNVAKTEELRMTVEWLEERGIRTMLYMGVASISSKMEGYKSEYQVWANLYYEDGTTDRIYQLPRTSGTGENPDVGSSSTQQFLDITNPEAVDWYMNTLWGKLIDIGIDGIKIDFCETMPNEGWLHDKTTGKDYYLEYDWYDDSIFSDDDVHHAFSTYFISLFYKKMNEMKEERGMDDGFVVLSRGGGIGSQRNPYLWEGDQMRTFEKIEDQLICLINTGISGIPFMTYDMAGYSYGGSSLYFTQDVEEESAIFARAIEFTAFTANIQTHGDVRHVYELSEETQEIYRRFCDLHEDMLPYIQKYSQVACDTGMPVVRHMALMYQDDANTYGLETQYMFGDALLVAPILKHGVTAKSVYIPEGEWLDLLTGETVTGGRTVTVNATLGQIPVFLRGDCSEEDRALLAEAFATENWTKISGVAIEIETA